MKLINWLAFTLIIGFLSIASWFYIVEPYILEHVPYYNEKWWWTWTLWIFAGLAVGAFWISLFAVAMPTKSVRKGRRRRMY